MGPSGRIVVRFVGCTGPVVGCEICLGFGPVVGCEIFVDFGPERCEIFFDLGGMSFFLLYEKII